MTTPPPRPDVSRPDPSADEDLRSSSLTDWDVIHDAREQGDRGRQALEAVSRRYWPAVYGFLRRSGRSTDEASDLTQGFLCDVILAGDLLSRADPARGRFRALLLSSLRNYIVQRHRHDTRQKRAPQGGVASLDASEHDRTQTARADDDPTRTFAIEWSRAMIRSVLERTREECGRSGLELHWAVFEARVVRPLLDGTPPLDYALLVQELDLEDESQAANMMITAKRRLARALRTEIGRTVSDPSEVDDELRDLMNDLGGRV